HTQGKTVQSEPETGSEDFGHRLVQIQHNPRPEESQRRRTKNLEIRQGMNVSHAVTSCHMKTKQESSRHDQENGVLISVPSEAASDDGQGNALDAETEDALFKTFHVLAERAHVD